MRSERKFLQMRASHRKRKGRKGQTLTEYAILVGLLAVVVISAMSLIGTKVRNVFVRINTAIVSTDGGASSSGGGSSSSGGSSSGGSSSSSSSSSSSGSPPPPPGGPPP